MRILVLNREGASISQNFFLAGTCQLLAVFWQEVVLFRKIAKNGEKMAKNDRFG